MGYGHLNIDEREVILKMRAQMASMQIIGDRIGRSKGTISRELSRNVSSTLDYKPHLAQRYYEKRRSESKKPYRLEEDSLLRKYVEKKLRQYWSPEQISGRIRQERGTYISVITIYNWIYRNRGEGGEFYKYLRQSHRRRRPRRGGEDCRGQMPDRRPIDKRPMIVNERRRIGDWESDTVEGGKGNGFIVTHVERKACYTVAVKVSDKSAETVSKKRLGEYSEIKQNLAYWLSKTPAERVEAVQILRNKKYGNRKKHIQKVVKIIRRRNDLI